MVFVRHNVLDVCRSGHKSDLEISDLETDTALRLDDIWVFARTTTKQLMRDESLLFF